MITGFLICSITSTPLWIICICLLTAARAEEFGSNELVLRNRTVLNAWQSSAHNEFCFWNRSTSAEDKFINNNESSYKYFHSHDKSTASNGYHWFVLQLNSSQYVTGVSIKGRESREDVEIYNRAAGIEIWTSANDVDFTGADHCSARNLSVYFNNTANSWALCGITRPGNGSNIVMGEIVRVNCTHKVSVKMILFRRYVNNITNNNGGYMSFSGITLNLGQPPILDFKLIIIITVVSVVIILILIGGCVKWVICHHRSQQSTTDDSTPATVNLEQRQMAESASQCVQEQQKIHAASADNSHDTGYLNSGHNAYQNMDNANTHAEKQVASVSSLEAELDHLTYAIVEPLSTCTHDRGQLTCTCTMVDAHVTSGCMYGTCPTGSEFTVYLTIIGDDLVEGQPPGCDSLVAAANQPLA